jgi:hypothetical protein
LLKPILYNIEGLKEIEEPATPLPAVDLTPSWMTPSWRKRLETPGKEAYKKG